MTDFAKDMFSDLRQSRLWPLAIALVVALVAVPVVLSKPAEESTAPPPPAISSGSSAVAELRPIADVKSASLSSERKSVTRLSARNPFEPLKKDGGGGDAGTAGADAGTSAGGGTAGTTAEGGSTTAGGGTTGSGSTGTGSTGSTGSGDGSGSGSSKPTTSYYTYVADVTFGKVDETTRRKLKQLRALPSSELPVIVFMGATSDGDKAVFLVASGADVTGDGTCKPSDTECVFLYMKPGDSVSIAVGDASGALTTYSLKLHDVEVDQLDEPPAASSKKAKAQTMKQGAQLSKQRARAKRQERIAKRKASARANGFFGLYDTLGF